MHYLFRCLKLGKYRIIGMLNLNQKFSKNLKICQGVLNPPALCLSVSVPSVFCVYYIRTYAISHKPALQHNFSPLIPPKCPHTLYPSLPIPGKPHYHATSSLSIPGKPHHTGFSAHPHRRNTYYNTTSAYPHRQTTYILYTLAYLYRRNTYII